MRILHPLFMLVFMFASVLSGAATSGPAKAGEATAGKSLVVISTWTQQKSTRSPSEIVIKRIPNEKTAARAHIDNPYIKSHFSEGWGYVNIFELEPGDYVVELYALNPLYFYARPKEPLRFSVKGGEKLYLGEAYFYIKDEHGHLEIRDKSERDLPLLASRNPGLKVEEFSKRIPGEPAKP